ncbi:hypothetical protein [Sphingomonas sp. GM_Shp_1]|uniref:hypothetical protein n=1 Tax=Sphingomonas sp. GM_Shp_1 TaxID=2937381 RepID=UPI00226B17EC|nr:hypothetical protein [Sphingomonas sp. GM_Shp_1]
MDQPPDIDLPQQETRPPRLEGWDWQQLERLTEALLNHEPNVVTATQYGTPGQTQFGIDTKADLRGGGCDVASCKAYIEIKKGDLAKWSTAFLDHWTGKWQAKGVKRFILTTTAPIAPTHVSDEADTERERFSAIGVDYELWGQTQLIERMRPHRGIVATYLGTFWVDIICGPQQREALQSVGSSVGTQPVGASQIAELRALLSGEAEQKVARALDDLRAGDLGAVERSLAELRAEPLWSQLDPGAQARVLRFAASAALHRDDLDGAATLDAEATAIQPAAEPRIAARIAMQRGGTTAGLAVLGTPSTRDGRQLQTALLLSSGNVDGAEEVLAILASDELDPETVRLQAWALLMRNKRVEALALVEQLEREAGHWTATIRTVAIARYAAALSPVLAPEWFLNASPVDFDLVRDDDEAHDWLVGATQGFQSLVDRVGDRGDRHWLLAALSNQLDRREDAETLARTLIAEDSGDPVPIAWSLSRRFNVDLAESRRRYANIYAEGTTEQIDVRIHALLLVSGGDARSARAALEAHLDAQSGEAHTEAETWIARLAADASEDDTGTPVPATDTFVDDIQAARASNDWSGVEAGFNVLAEGGHPQTLAAAQLIAAEGQWAILQPHRDTILAFATAEAVRIVAYLVASTGVEGELVTFVEEHRHVFRNGAPPPDVRRLIADQQQRAGDLVGALETARALSAESGAAVDRHLEARLRASIGDTGGAARIVRDLMRSADLAPDAAMVWVETLRASDMALARELWRFAVARDGQRKLAVSAYIQAFSLGLEREAAPFHLDVARAAEDGTGSIRTFDVADLPDFIASQNATAEEHWALYLDGRIPAHLLAENQNVTLDALLLESPNSERGPLKLRLWRNGARPRHLDVGLPWSRWRLHMDISALLVAAHADLLDIVERHPNPIRISPAVPAALVDMHRRVAPSQPTRLALLRRLTDMVGNSLAERARRDTDRVVALRDTDGNRDIDFDVRQLVDAAFAAGVIDETMVMQARAAMAAPDTESGEVLTPLVAGEGLWLAGAAAEQLLEIDILPALCLGFDIAIDPTVARGIRQYAAAEEAKATRAAFLDNLRERIRLGIEAGRYELIRRHADREIDTLNTRNPTTLCLIDLLNAEEIDGAVSWYQDRNLTGYPANRTHVIVELLDVLDALVADGVLSEADARARLSRLLGQGAGLNQLETADVIPAILAAPVVDGTLRETPALRALRRNRAAQRLMDARLKVGGGDDPDDRRPDETRLVLADMKLAEECLAAIWSDPTQTAETCVARSEWVWATLRIERSLRAIPEEKPGDSASMLASLCFQSAVETLAFPSDLPPGLRRVRRRTFSNWFWLSALAPHQKGDPDILERIADHIEALYLPRLTGRDPTATRPGLELRLFKLRAAALPQPLLSALATRPIGAYLGLRSDEVVTIRDKRFEADRFWRAVRTARCYGPTNVRTRDGRKCRIVRTDNGVAISGGVRARLADTLCSLFDPQVRPLDRYDQLLAELELTPADLEKFAADGRAARTPNRLISALISARKRSAKAVYVDLDAAFQPKLRISLGAFFPPPASALLNYLRIEPGDAPFTDRLSAAAARLVGDVGSVMALRRLSGLPIAGLLDLCDFALTPDIQAELDHAVTPVALYRQTEIALPTVADAAARQALLSSLIAKVRVAGPSFSAILRWTVRAFWQDQEFRALGMADRLVLTWVHANRLLDTFLRRRADPYLLTCFFSEGHFDENIADRINIERFGDRDAASSSAMTADALLFHMIGALIGDAPVADFIDDAELEKLVAGFRVVEVGEPLAIPALILRNFTGQNLLGSFLTAHAPALDALIGDPMAKRESLGDDAIRNIRANFEDGLAWSVLMQHSRTGLSPAQEAVAQDLVRTIDLDGLTFGPRDGLPVPRAMIRTIGLLLPQAEHGRALDVIRALARQAALSGVSTALTNDTEEGSPLDPVHEILELAACYAGIEEAGAFERFEDGMVAAVEEWPAAVTTLRQLVDRLIRSNGVIHAEALWRLYLYLNACP